MSLSFCRGSRVEGSMSRARVPSRGSRVTFFFHVFFLEKVIIDAINVIKTNKKNLKNKWRVNIFQLLGGGGGGGGGIEKSSGTSQFVFEELHL